MNEKCVGQWLLDGKPRGMQFTSYYNYKRAKRHFRFVQEEAANEFLNQAFTDIDQAAGCDIRLFWRLIRKRKSRSVKIYPEIIHNDVVHNTPEAVVNAFADYFSSVYSSVEDPNFDSSFFEAVNVKYKNILDTCPTKNGHLPGGPITIEEVELLIKDLHLRKAPGHDLVQNEHIKYGG